MVNDNPTMTTGIRKSKGRVVEACDIFLNTYFGVKYEVMPHVCTISLWYADKINYTTPWWGISLPNLLPSDQNLVDPIISGAPQSGLLLLRSIYSHVEYK